jgi:hypothetical protein
MYRFWERGWGGGTRSWPCCHTRGCKKCFISTAGLLTICLGPLNRTSCGTAHIAWHTLPSAASQRKGKHRKHSKTQCVTALNS